MAVDRLISGNGSGTPGNFGGGSTGLVQFGVELTHHPLQSRFIATADRSPNRTRNTGFYAAVLLLRCSHDKKTPKAPALGYYALGLGARERRKGIKRDPNYTP